MSQQRRNGIAAVFRLMTAGLCLTGTCSMVRAQENAPTAKAPAQNASAGVEALVYSTMPSTAAHRPEMALDGNEGTWYQSAYDMSVGDTFLVLLSQPVPVQSIRVTTGDADGANTLTNARVETSEDAVHFNSAADFNAKGVAEASLANRTVRAIRIRRNRQRGGGAALVVREMAIRSAVPISHVQMGPGRAFSDISEAPDLAVWAKTAEHQMEEYWPDITALLYSDRFITPNMINVVYRTGPNLPPGATGGGVMTVDIEWCRKHPEDTGLTVHEIAHAIQAYSAYNPVWLVEGIADYIRWIRFEPQNYRARINTKTATYHDSYRTTGTFLGWCELHYDSRLVTKLSQDVRFGNYTNDKFKQYCGKDVDTLWSEFTKAYDTDPVHLLTVPVAPEDRPRTLPPVKAGSSVSANLSTAFNSIGFYNDNQRFEGAEGFDGEGTAYSAAQLGTAPSSKGVVFHPGPAGMRNMVSSRGQVVSLPSGTFTTLWLLGAGAEGSHKAQTLTLTYTDGTTEMLTQNFSDWYQPQNFPGEFQAVKMAYRIAGNGEKDDRPFYAYSYGFPINASKTVKSLTLPNNPYVKILAVTLAN